MSFETCLSFTLKEEGGFVNDPRDPGGATNKGITLATFRAATKNPRATVADLKALTDAQAGQIYRADYWNAVSGDRLPPGVDLMVFDFGVNAGPGRSIKLLQKALNVSPDGLLGPGSLTALNAADPAALVAALALSQGTYYHSLSAFSAFGRGWTARLERRRGAALSSLNK